jgi:hypothetical protein
MLARIDANIKTMQERARTDRKPDREKMKAIRQIGREERSAERKAVRVNLRRMMEEIMTANQAKTDVKFKDLTEKTEEETRPE